MDRREPSDIPVYPYSGAYARASGELESFRESRQMNQECRTAIDAAINAGWDGTRLSDSAVKGVLAHYGAKRVAYVLADTVQQSGWDGRFSPDNRTWARNVPMFQGTDSRWDSSFQSHPVKLDEFLTKTRKELEQMNFYAETMWNVQSVPVYQGTREEAENCGETAEYWKSHNANVACKEAVDRAMAAYHIGNHLLDEGAKSVLKLYGAARVSYVLAATVQALYYDGRFSRQNKQWAEGIRVFEPQRERDCVCMSHPAGLDIFISQTREEILAKTPLTRSDIKAEAEHILQQFQREPEPNSRDGRHFAASVSEMFMRRAKAKDVERLKAMLPFPSLELSSTERGGRTYALISKEENREQKLVLRKPSIRKQLAAKPSGQESADRKPCTGRQRENMAL